MSAGASGGPGFDCRPFQTNVAPMFDTQYRGAADGHGFLGNLGGKIRKCQSRVSKAITWCR